ncbi:MAG: hypothetical protein HGA41_11025 [Syntrophaceae bacterium]|nr:hypothetical protein [Syntrophaceae bacterium]
MCKSLSILLVDKNNPSPLKERIQKSGRSILVHTALDKDVFYRLAAQSDIGCLVISRSLFNAATTDEQEILQDIRQFHPLLPIFLDTDAPSDGHFGGGDHLNIGTQPLETMADTIEVAISSYQHEPVTPFFSVLQAYANKKKYSWHTPGHNGGAAFLPTNIGKTFYDFYGEKAFKADLSVSVPDLGSLLEHTSPIQEAEEEAAKAFMADRTYFVTNGTSTANKILWHARVSRNDSVLVDRNCHKSLVHAVIMTGARPQYIDKSL